MTAARMLRFLWSPALVLALTALSSPGDAQCQTATVSIPGSPYRVLLDGDTLAVAYFGSPSMIEFFRHQSGAWNLESSFPIGTNGDFKALEGDTLIFADQAAEVAGLQYAGKVVVYERTAGVWNAVQELVPPVLDHDLHFGSAVAMEGDTLVVGEADGQAPRLGRAYVYARQGGSWILQAELPSPGPQRFGRALALQGDRLVVGADNGAFCYQGVGAIWTQVQEIVPQSFELDLGEVVRLDGSLLAISSRRTVPAPRSWGVSVFEQNAGVWTESGRIDSTEFPNGRPFVLAEGRLFGGFSGDGDAGLSAGAVFVFGATAGVWSLQDKLYTDNNYGGATGLGRDLGADAGTLAVAGGDVYVFALADPDCPHAAFSAAPLADPAPLAVAFTDESAGVVTEWSWSFGDGGSASDEDPSHVYAWPGRYTVDLIARGPAGVSREIRRDLVFVGSSVTARCASVARREFSK